MIFFKDIRQKQLLYISDGNNCSLLKALLTDGSSAVFFYRLMKWCSIHKLSPIAYFFQYLNKLLNGCIIGINADFGEGLVMAHPIGVIINSKVKAGNRIVIESGVVIGDEKGNSPLLGDDIFIGSGAKIIGGIKIGSRVKIGANAVIVKSAPSDATLIGIPGEIYKKC